MRTAAALIVLVALSPVPPAARGAEAARLAIQPLARSLIVTVPPQDPGDPPVRHMHCFWNEDPDGPPAIYFLQASYDLQEWFYLPEVLEGGVDAMEAGFENLTAEGTSPVGFMRVIAVEAESGTTPEQGDADSDGLANGAELTLHNTDPLSDDTDGDGLPDGWEVAHGLDPKDSTGENGATGNTDGDAWDNLAEYNADTDPNDWDTDGDGIADDTDSDPNDNNAVANPDGEGLPAGLDTGLLGRWDLENSVPGSGGVNQFANSATPSMPAVDGGTVALDSDGMVSTGAGFDANADYLRVNPDIVAGELSFSISMWFRFEKDYLQNKPGTTNTVFFAFNDHFTAYPQFQLHAYKALTPLGTQKLTFSHYANGILQPDVYAEIPLDNPLDDGQWQHLVFSKNAGSIKIYRNAVEACSVNTPAGAWTVGPDGYLCFGKLGPAPAGADTAFRGSMDRLCFWSRGLSAAEALDLYHQDIDHDGLWDITEQRSLLWRDANGDGIRTADETDYTINPFQWDPADSDHDDDGLFSLTEQDTTFTCAAHPDSDGDLLPDGWEDANGLDPNNPDSDGDGTPDGQDDVDGDGATNLQEFIHQSDPNSTDSDGDGTEDGPEIAQGSHPGDDRDGGLPIPAKEQLSIMLAVGDQSDSHSEDYIMNVFRIDPDTGVEIPYYVLRSGGHGLYSGEQIIGIFRKSDTYTFQIDWQSSNLGSGPPQSGDGPDFDYTFKIEPQNDDRGILIDQYDATLENAATNDPILGYKTNVETFLQTVEPKRVLRTVADLAIVKADDENKEIDEDKEETKGEWNGEDVYYTVLYCDSEKQLKMALRTTNAHVAFAGHSNFGLGPAFGWGDYTSLNEFMNVGGQGKASIDWPYFRSTQGHPNLLVQEEEIIQAAANYMVNLLPVSVERFPNDQDVAPGQTFTLQGEGTDKRHYTWGGEANKRLVVNSQGDVPELKYESFFFSGCNSGRDFIETFQHGTFFFTKGCPQTDEMSGLLTFFKGIIEGKTWAEIDVQLETEQFGVPGMYGYKKF